jgi:hypothetical protein
MDSWFRSNDDWQGKAEVLTGGESDSVPRYAPQIPHEETGIEPRPPRTSLLLTEQWRVQN